MAQFRGTLQGDRGGASRLGSKKNGLMATVRGWTAGITVHAYHVSATDEDVFEVREDGGSSGYSGQPLVTVRKGPNDEKPRIAVHVKQ